MQDARQALLHHDSDQAIQVLTQALTTAAPAEIAEIHFLLAQAYLAADQHDQALALLRPLSQDPAFSSQHPEVHYWLGQALLPQDPTRAAQAFETYAQHSPHLAAEIWIQAGDAWLQAQDPDAGARAYTQALNRASGLVTALHAREGLARAALAAQNPQEAIAQYQAILEQARSPGYRAEIEYLLGQAQEAAGQPAEAWASYRQALQAEPKSRYAYLALIQLVNAQQAVDPLLRAQIDIHAGAYTPAIAVLQQHLAATPEDRTDQAYTLLAQAYEGLKNYQAAAEAWRQVLSLPGETSFKNQAWLGLGRSLWRQGLTEEARLVYLQAAENSPDPDVASTALWWAAVLAGQNQDQWRRAAQDFARLAREFPQSEYAAQAGFRAGLINYRLGDMDTARAIWESHAQAGRSLWHAAADFWLGKRLLALGDKTAAWDHWRQVAETWGWDNFYGVRSAQKLAQAGQPLPPTPPPSSSQDPAAWVAAMAPTAPPLPEPLPELATAQEWLRLGRIDRAHRELEGLRRTWSKDPLRLWALARYAYDQGMYDIAIRAALRLVSLSGRPLHQAPEAIQRLVYPRPYDDLIQTYAREFQLDPALYLALLRQESLFWAPAVSPVGAQGLAQIMPGTGQGAARQLGLENFHPQDLSRPVIGLRLGAYILRQELDRGDGNLFWALAAYNAGPGNAAFWWDLAQGDEDLFVELVSFKETQHYIRTIIVQAQHYRRIYPDLR